MSFKHEVEIDPYAEAHEPYPLILAEKVQIDCYIRLRVPRTIDVCLSSLQLTGTDTKHVAVELKKPQGNRPLTFGFVLTGKCRGNTTITAKMELTNGVVSKRTFHVVVRSCCG